MPPGFLLYIVKCKRRQIEGRTVQQRRNQAYDLQSSQPFQMAKDANTKKGFSSFVRNMYSRHKMYYRDKVEWVTGHFV